MMWRERIAAARERSGFSDEDRSLAGASGTCAVGEVTGGIDEAYRRYTRTALEGEERSVISHWTVGIHHSAAFTCAVRHDDIAEAERLLDAIEDRALQIKRESV